VALTQASFHLWQGLVQDPRYLTGKHIENSAKESLGRPRRIYSNDSRILGAHKRRRHGQRQKKKRNDKTKPNK
jgi:hypothetical protein